MAATPRPKRQSALREALPCVLTIFAFIVPLTLLITLKLAQALDLWPQNQLIR